MFFPARADQSGMLRIAALLGAAMALGTFGATLTHQLHASGGGGAGDAFTVALSGVASFLAGLVWLGVGLTLLLQRPSAPAERALYVASVAAAVHFFLEAGGASALTSSFGIVRDAAAVVAALALVALAGFVTAPPRRFSQVLAVLGPLAWLLLPRTLAWLAPALAALLIALGGRQYGRAFTARQQATWLAVGLVALVASGLAAAVLSPLGVGWTRDLAALMSLAVPLTAALALQKVQLLETERIVSTLGVGTVLFAGAILATLGANTMLGALPAERRALLSGFFGLGLLLVAARLCDPAAARLLDRLFPERTRIRAALADAPQTLVAAPFDAWAKGLSERLLQALGREAVTVWRVDAFGQLHGIDDRGQPRSARIRPHGRLWALASAFGAPLAPDDLVDLPLEPTEALWLTPQSAHRALVPLVFERRLVGFLELLGPGPTAPVSVSPVSVSPVPVSPVPFSDEAWRSLAAFAERVSLPFAAAVLRAEAEAQTRATARLERAHERVHRGRDARGLQRGLQGVASHLRHRASAQQADAREAALQLGVCEVLLSEAAEWETPITRRLTPLRPLLDWFLLARVTEIRAARVELEADPALDSWVVYTDGDALAVVWAAWLDVALGALSHFDGPRALRITAGPVPNAPGFVRLCLFDTGPNRTSPPGGADDSLLTPLLRTLGVRRSAEGSMDGNRTYLELPLVGR